MTACGEIKKIFFTPFFSLIYRSARSVPETAEDPEVAEVSLDSVVDLTNDSSPEGAGVASLSVALTMPSRLALYSIVVSINSSFFAHRSKPFSSVLTRYFALFFPGEISDLFGI
jgi:hypothetical protein